MAKKKSHHGKKHKSEPLEYEMRGVVSYGLIKKSGKDPSELLGAAWWRLYQNEELTDGVRLIGRWKNPVRADKALADWRSTEDAGQGSYRASVIAFKQTILDKVKPAREKFDFRRVSSGGGLEFDKERERFRKRSEAAKRGAITRKIEAGRRARLAKAKRRSAIAKKAAATRKRNARAAARAAKKKTKGKKRK